MTNDAKHRAQEAAGEVWPQTFSTPALGVPAVGRYATPPSERDAIIAWLNRMRDEASRFGQADAVFWIVQIRRNIERGDHLKETQP